MLCTLGRTRSLSQIEFPPNPKVSLAVKTSSPMKALTADSMCLCFDFRQCAIATGGCVALSDACQFLKLSVRISASSSGCQALKVCPPIISPSMFAFVLSKPQCLSVLVSSLQGLSSYCQTLSLCRIAVHLRRLSLIACLCTVDSGLAQVSRVSRFVDLSRTCAYLVQKGRYNRESSNVRPDRDDRY